MLYNTLNNHSKNPHCKS